MIRAAIATTLAAGAITIGIFACTGDDAGGSGPPPGSDGGNNVPNLAPDAAPPANCPINCLPPAPEGWNGPNATYDGPEATKPSCLLPYTRSEGATHIDASAPPASCSCGGETVTGATCSANVELHQSSNCTDSTPIDDGVAYSTGPCHKLETSAARMLLWGQKLADAGTCTYPNAATVKADAGFETVQVACSLPTKNGCENRADCVASPIPPTPFTKLCIFKPGIESCPSADYAERFVAYRSIDDQRGCSPCTGTPSGGACGHLWGFTSNETACATAGTEPSNTYSAGACIVFGGVNNFVNIQPMGPRGTTCAVNAGSAIPDGGITSIEPVTYCCNR